MTLPLNEILLGDCLEVMRSLPDGCVDALISDPPYGTTALKWDKAIDLAAFWTEVHRACKVNAAMVVFSAQPFTTDLIVSNRKHFKYEIIWDKGRGVDFLLAKKKPLKAHENIILFARKSPVYYPQMTEGKPYNAIGKAGGNYPVAHYGNQKAKSSTDWNTGERYPLTIVKASNRSGKSLHHTQKPLDLMQWLVRTYTNSEDLILDPYAGSASTCHAALLEGRNFIGIERDLNYHAIAQQRIAATRGEVA